MMVLAGGAVSYERDAPVRIEIDVVSAIDCGEISARWWPNEIGARLGLSETDMVSAIDYGEISARWV